MSDTNTGGVMSTAARKEGKVMAMANFVNASTEPLPGSTPAAAASTPAESPDTATDRPQAGIAKLAKPETPKYRTVPLSTRIDDWLDTEIDKASDNYSASKQEIVTNALMEYLGVRPPHERKGKGRQ